jgi:16S rRNA (guanine1516-N2)-methyltransferase
MPINNKIAVVASCDTVLKKAQELALHLNLPLITPTQPIGSFIYLLIVTHNSLELRENVTRETKPIFIDFLAPQISYRTKYGGGKNQLIAKAVGIKNRKNLTLIDATAGFGIDAFILASLGCEVTMLERSPIIHALLADGLERLHKKPDLKISLKLTQSFDYINKILQENLEKPDVIYLDPMYPKRSKSALNKRTMRVLHEIVGDDNDASKLLDVALKCVNNRVVVKRPKQANYLGGIKPNLQFFSQGSSRYDIYFPDKNKSEKTS